MRQYLLPKHWDGGSRCEIEGRDARYIGRVLRLGPGDRFPGLDREGKRRDLEILESGEGKMLLAVGVPSAFPTNDKGNLPDARGLGDARKIRGAGVDLQPGQGTEEAAGEQCSKANPRTRILLAQGILKGAKMDLVVRQAAETGVSLIIPLSTSRTVGRVPEAESTSNRRLRWERIIKEALQQSGSAVKTLIADPLDLGKLPAAFGLEAKPLASIRNAKFPEPQRAIGVSATDIPASPSLRRVGILLHETPLAQAALHEYLTDEPGELLVCVGPEGGFSPEEAAFLIESGFLPYKLPGAILRAETAAVYAVAAAQIILSERSSWKANGSRGSISSASQ